jgi:hypothetical protein
MLVTQFISALVFVLVFTCCALLVSALAVVALSTLAPCFSRLFLLSMQAV